MDIQQNLWVLLNWKKTENHYWYSQGTDLSLWRLQAEDNPFDIKPQNIMLDDDFNAKTSDFELSKLIDWDQSKVVTIMRGTPAYLAPK